MSLPHTIRSIDDLSTAAELLLQPDSDYRPVFAPEFDLMLRVRGASWDGLIDSRVARYVAEFQSAFDRMQKQCGVELDEKPLVKLAVEDGSTKLFAKKLAELFNSLIENMDSKDKMAVAIAFLLALSGVATTKVLQDTVRERARLEATTGQITVLAQGNAEALVQALQIIDADRPNRTLIQKMGPEDRIQLPGRSEELSREEARRLYPRKTRTTPTQFQIDDNYHVAAVALGMPIRFELTRGDYTFKAELSNLLAQEDKEAFIESVRGAIDGGGAARLALQVDAMINDREIIAATIVGIGRTPREEAQDIVELLR